MKVLESTPERYDRGIRLLSRGRIDDVCRRVAALASGPGRRVLDIGCGTGAVSLACAALGVRVIAIDSNAGSAWLICADSKGMDVWCAAGGGPLTHHEIIAAIRTSGIGRLVDRRQIVLPQLCATGCCRGCG